MTTQTKYRKYDSESDYYAMGYRMYSAEFGRFLAMDPLFEAMPRHNPYHYSFNSPMFWSDPSGLVPKVFEETIQELQQKKWEMESFIELIFSNEKNRADYVPEFAMESKFVISIRTYKFRIGAIGYGENGSAFYTENGGYDVECKEVVYSNGTFDRGYRVSNDDGSMSYLESGYFDNLGNEQITERNFNVTTNVIGAENAWLSNVQIALDTYGTIDQGLGGMVAGIASGIIDVYRGNYVWGAIALAASIPIAGIVFDAMKQGRNAGKLITTFKHSKYGFGSILGVSDDIGRSILENSIELGNKRFGYYNKKIYQFMDGNDGTWHGFEAIYEDKDVKKIINIFKKNNIIDGKTAKRLRGGR